jgi:hypothetical protein
METDGKDPTDLGLAHFGHGGTKKDRTMAKRAVHPLRGDMASGRALDRLLRLFDTRDEPGQHLGESAMQRADLQTLNDRLNELSEALNGKQLSKAALTVWAGVLKEYPIETICDAIGSWARDKTKFPAPSEIGKLCAGFVSDRLERQAKADKSAYAMGAHQILADARIAREHLARIKKVLARGRQLADGDLPAPGRAVDPELQLEREAMMSEHLPV